MKFGEIGSGTNAFFLPAQFSVAIYFYSAAVAGIFAMGPVLTWAASGSTESEAINTDLIPESENGAAQLEEVVVTARRTHESQQDVPVAVTLMSSDVLQRESITTLQDLQGRVPSLIMSTGGQQRNTEMPTIRGQGGTYGGGTGVAQYYAEVPLPADTTESNVGSAGKFFDLADIQVLKGSQGTLFGRNTTGGAILLTPNKPAEEPSLHANIETGNHSLTGHELVVNIPVIADKLLLRAGYKYQDRDGFTKDVVNGTRYDDRHYETSRLGLIIRPTEQIENYLQLYYTESHTNGTGTVIKQANPAGLNALIMSQMGMAPNPSIPPESQTGCLVWDALLTKEATQCGALFAEEQKTRNSRHVELSADPTDNVWTGAAINTLSVDLSDELVLRYIASYSFLKHQYRWDTDGSRAEWTDMVLPDNQYQTDIDIVTHEMQLQGSSLNGNLDFTVGIYHETQEPRGPEGQQTRALYNDAVVEWEIERETFGPYAQATYNFGHLKSGWENWEITAGIRNSFDDVSGNSTFVQSQFGVPGPPAILDGGIKDSAITWTFGLDYKTETSLTYTKISRGYKVGGFTITAADPDKSEYDSEYVLNYEIGNKLDFTVGDIPVRLNTSVYYTDYTDMQRHAVDVYFDPKNPSPAPRLGAAVVNAGEASISGFEMELTVMPFPRLILLASYSYTDAEYDEYVLKSGSSSPLTSCNGRTVALGQTIDLSCLPFLYSPEHQYSLTVIADPIQSDVVGDVTTSLTWTWTDKNYTSATTLPRDEPGAWLDSIGLLNASINWERIFNSSFDLQLFGTNLLDKKYIMGNQNVWNTLYFQAVTYGEPRMYGARLTYRWE